MTQEQEGKYESVNALKKVLSSLKGRKFTLDCGHHVTFHHNFGNDITIQNGKELEIICSLCGY